MTDSLDPPPAPPETDPDHDTWDAALAAVYGPTPVPDDGQSLFRILSQSLGVQSNVLLPEAPEWPGSPALRPSTMSQRRVGRYEVLGEIARGGMGVILEVRDVDLGRDVAMKVMRADAAKKPHMVQRFVEEAQIGGQLQHPGIVPVYEMGLDSQLRPFFVMKLVRGKTLASILAERAGPGEEHGRLLQIFEHVCQTIAYVHSRKVIHRDIKPANIMVGSFGEAQVVDWGFAKVLTRGGLADEKLAHERALAETSTSDAEIATVRSSSGSQSLAGSVLGTPSYMPPEQARGDVQHLDERADVFALGAILCEIITGAPPYIKQPGSDVMTQAQAADLDTAFERIDGSGAAPEIRDLARRCLAPDPADRIRHAGLVAAEITGYLSQAEARTRAAEVSAAEARVQEDAARRARRLTIALATAVLALVAGGAGFVWWRGETQRQHTRDVRAALTSARAHLDAREMSSAVSSLEQAESLISRRDVDRELQQEVASFRGTFDQVFAESAATERSQRFLHDLRLAHTHPREEGANNDHEYQRVFAAHGVPVLDLSPEEAARRILTFGGDVPRQVAFALDDWASRLRTSRVARQSARDRDAWRHVLKTARFADPDPWRTELRDALLSEDDEALRGLAADLDPDAHDPRSVCLLAVGLMVRGGEAQSLELLRRAFRVHPDDFWVNYYLVVHLASLGRSLWERRDDPTSDDGLEEALRHAWIVVAQQPDLAYLRHQLARLLQRRELPAEALIQMREAVERAPKNGLLRRELARLLVEQGEEEEARNELAAALDRDPSSYAVRSAVAGYRESAAIRQGLPLPDLARRLRDATDEPNPRPELFRQLAFTLFRMADWDGASAAADAALDLYPLDLDARWVLARTRLAQGRFQEAWALAERSRADGDDNPDLDRILREALELQSVYDDLPGALATPGQVELSAVVLARLGRVQEASAAFEKAWVDGPPKRPNTAGAGARRPPGGDPPTEIRNAVASLVAAASAADDPDEQARLLARAAEWAQVELPSQTRWLGRRAGSIFEGWEYDVRLHPVRPLTWAFPATLPEPVRQSWELVWQRVAELGERRRLRTRPR